MAGNDPNQIKHPAKFSDAVLSVMSHYLWAGAKVLDPFGGTSKIKYLGQGGSHIYTIELEPEWAHSDPFSADAVADALNLPFADASFDAIATSPCYGNRMADHHEAKDDSTRITYRHTLGRPLDRRNTGSLQWGPAYRAKHFAAWEEAHRVLKVGGLFLLNISDHIRRGEAQGVNTWHLGTLLNLGFAYQTVEIVETKRMRKGSNWDLRMPNEYVYVLTKKPMRKEEQDDGMDNSICVECG